MNAENRYQALPEKHRKIEVKLMAEMKRPMPDSLALQRLKRKKLLLRDEIESWERLMRAVRFKPDLRAATLHS